MEKYLINGKFYSYKELGEAVKSLTPPTADEIVKELNEYHGDKVGIWIYKKNKFIFKDNKYSRIYETIAKDNRYYLQDLELTLAHKITSYFMSLEE